MSGLNAIQGDSPIFGVEVVDNVFVLKIVSDPTLVNYVSRQHEYNRLYKQFDDATGNHLLFDLSDCIMLDSVTIGIMVSLTRRVRENEGDAIIVAVVPNLNKMLARLMLLQPDNKQATWQTYSTRDEGLALLNASRN